MAQRLPDAKVMSPGGHLVTTVAACAATAYATGSLPLTAAVAAGSFFIDLDHVFDYIVIDKQRDLRPSAFLRYYVGGHIRRAVLPLHSYELFAALIAIAWWTDDALVAGYLVGALLHLALDIVFNGQVTPYSIAAFYSFGYRLYHRFDAAKMLGLAERPVGGGFWAMFFASPEAVRPLPGLAPRRVASRIPDSLA